MTDAKEYNAGFLAGYKKAMSEMPDIVRCKDCKYAILTYSGECKYCKKRIDDNGGMDQLYLPGDWYCADGERKEGDGE